MGGDVSTAQVWAIEIQGLTKSFGNHLALKGIDLKVRQGETVVIFGPNGAGKTTLIKVLATIMNPTSGRVLVGGLGLKNNAEKIRRRIRKRIDGLERNPRPPAAQLLQATNDLHRIRAGRYRILYTIQENLLLVLMVAIGHRRNVYERIAKRFGRKRRR